MRALTPMRVQASFWSLGLSFSTALAPGLVPGAPEVSFSCPHLHLGFIFEALGCHFHVLFDINRFSEHMCFTAINLYLFKSEEVSDQKIVWLSFMSML